jgi:hypothetical protein
LRAENIVIKSGQAFEVENFYALEQMLGKIKAIRAPVNGQRSKRLGNFASAKWIAGQLRLFAAETVWIRLEGDMTSTAAVNMSPSDESLNGEVLLREQS